MQAQDLIVLADTKHGLRERVLFFSSRDLFAAMGRSGVRHVAIEMPRVLGRQAMTIETSDDVEAFAQDVIRANRWHFTNPGHPEEEAAETQHRVASALGRQVLLAKQLGIDLIFYDFNNPLGRFAFYGEFLYPCPPSFASQEQEGLGGNLSSAGRNAALMRKRLSYDGELAARIAREVQSKGGGKLVVISGYAHAVTPGGIADQLQHRLGRIATVVAVFKDETERRGFRDFLWEQSRLLSIDLTRAPKYLFTIASGTLRREESPERYAALDGSRDLPSAAICSLRTH